MNRVALFVAVGMLIASLAIAHQTAPGAAPVKANSVVWDGEVVDPQCFFLHEARGLDHVACATRCAKGGQGLAFLEERTGKVYPLIAKSHGRSQNEVVLPHIGKRVRVTGVVYERGQDAVLQVLSVAVLPKVSR